MATIKVRVQGEIATNLTPEVRLVCQNEKYDVEFEFDESWEKSAVKTALFIYNGQLIPIAFDGTICKIPVLYETELLHIGVKSNDIDGLHTTTPARVGCLLSANDIANGEIKAPEQDVYDQIIELLNKNIQSQSNSPEISSTATPFLLSKKDENGARRATIVLGEPFTDKETGKTEYKAGMQAETVTLQSFKIDENGNKTAGAGISVQNDGEIKFSGKLINEDGEPLLDDYVTLNTVQTLLGTKTWYKYQTNSTTSIGGDGFSCLNASGTGSESYLNNVCLVLAERTQGEGEELIDKVTFNYDSIEFESDANSNFALYQFRPPKGQSKIGTIAVVEDIKKYYEHHVTIRLSDYSEQYIFKFISSRNTAYTDLLDLTFVANVHFLIINEKDGTGYVYNLDRIDKEDTQYGFIQYSGNGKMYERFVMMNDYKLYDLVTEI